MSGLVFNPAWDGSISVSDAETLAENVGGMDALLPLLVPVAQGFAQPPISNFQVGAVALGGSGALYFGANLEFPGQALPYTVHAEQSATLNAFVHKENQLSSLAISAAPCGYCRQFLYETCNPDSPNAPPPVAILLVGQASQPLTYFLPDPFGPGDLGMTTRLLDPQANPVYLNPPVDATTAAALLGAQACYAPYSKGYAAVAATVADGRTLWGPLAENAAYNPSVSPMEAALNAVSLAGLGWGDLKEITLVQVPSSTSQVEASRNVLATVSGLGLNVAIATAGTAGKRAVETPLRS